MNALACLLVMATLPLQDAAPVRVDFGRDIGSWNLFDADGDGDLDVVAWFPDADPASFAFALQQADRSYRVLDAQPLPRGTVAVALGRFHGAGVDVAAITPEGASLVSVSDGEIAVREHAVEATTVFRAAGSGSPRFWHWPVDVDGDGHDDLHLPGEDGLLLFFGDGQGKLEAGPALPLGGERIVSRASAGLFDFERSYPRPVFANVVGSPAPDLCWFDERGLAFAEQTEPRAFGEPRRFDLPWLASGDVGGVMEQTDVKLRDLDADGRDDLVLGRMRTEKGKIGDMQTTVLVLMNQARGEAPFGRQPQNAILLRGVVGIGPRFRDVDADGHLDLVMGSYGAGLSDAVSRFFGRVSATLYVHCGTGRSDEPFSPTPTVKRDVNVSSDDFSRWGIRHSVAIDEDFTGDGVADSFEMRADGTSHRAVIRRGVVKDGALTISDAVVATVEVNGVEGVSLRTLREGGATAAIFDVGLGLVVLEAR